MTSGLKSHSLAFLKENHIHWFVFLCKWICLWHVLSFMTTTGYEIGTCTFMVLLLGTYIFEVSQSFFELPQSHVCWCSPIVSLQHCKLLLITYCILYEHVYKPQVCLCACVHMHVHAKERLTLQEFIIYKCLRLLSIQQAHIHWN